MTGRGAFRSSPRRKNTKTRSSAQFTGLSFQERDANENTGIPIVLRDVTASENIPIHTTCDNIPVLQREYSYVYETIETLKMVRKVLMRDMCTQTDCIIQDSMINKGRDQGIRGVDLGNNNISIDDDLVIDRCAKQFCFHYQKVNNWHMLFKLSRDMKKIQVKVIVQSDRTWNVYNEGKDITNCITNAPKHLQKDLDIANILSKINDIVECDNMPSNRINSGNSFDNVNEKLNDFKPLEPAEMDSENNDQRLSTSLSTSAEQEMLSNSFGSEENVNENSCSHDDTDLVLGNENLAETKYTPPELLRHTCVSDTTDLRMRQMNSAQVSSDLNGLTNDEISINLTASRNVELNTSCGQSAEDLVKDPTKPVGEGIQFLEGLPVDTAEPDERTESLYNVFINQEEQEDSTERISRTKLKPKPRARGRRRKTQSGNSKSAKTIPSATVTCRQNTSSEHNIYTGSTTAMQGDAPDFVHSSHTTTSDLVTPGTITPDPTSSASQTVENSFTFDPNMTLKMEVEEEDVPVYDKQLAPYSSEMLTQPTKTLSIKQRVKASTARPRGKTRAEIQKAYRERQKQAKGTEYFQKESERVKKYYKKPSELSKEMLERKRLYSRKCRLKKKIQKLGLEVLENSGLSAHLLQRVAVGQGRSDTQIEGNGLHSNTDKGTSREKRHATEENIYPLNRQTSATSCITDATVFGSGESNLLKPEIRDNSLCTSLQTGVGGLLIKNTAFSDSGISPEHSSSLQKSITAKQSHKSKGRKKSRSEIQKAYRERLKQRGDQYDAYLRKERERSRKNYVKSSELNTEQLLRRREMNIARVRKHKLKKLGYIFSETKDCEQKGEENDDVRESDGIDAGSPITVKIDFVKSTKRTKNSGRTKKSVEDNDSNFTHKDNLREKSGSQENMSTQN